MDGCMDGRTDGRTNGWIDVIRTGSLEMAKLSFKFLQKVIYFLCV